eukprot:5109912-Pleurochrysis_carterae.AAC.3
MVAEFCRTKAESQLKPTNKLYLLLQCNSQLDASPRYAAGIERVLRIVSPECARPSRTRIPAQSPNSPKRVRHCR